MYYFKISGYRPIVALLVLIVLSCASHASTFQTIYSFCKVWDNGNCTDGANPTTGVVPFGSGLLGVTEFGGTNNLGTLFQVSSNGAYKVLYSFCAKAGCADGARPAALIVAQNHKIYGVTLGGGTGAFGQGGTIFEVASNGSITTLYSFCNQQNCVDGVAPRVSGSDSAGNLYGATPFGGTNGSGNIFELSPLMKLTNVYSFCSAAGCADGATPESGVILSADGNFYAVANGGGANGAGAIVQVTHGGNEKVLHSFCAEANCEDGASPYGFAEGAPGVFVGATEGGGGNYGAGTLFSITSAGKFTLLHSFCGADYCSDGGVGGFVISHDGTFYGTLGTGGAHGFGGLFSATTSGDFKLLYSFCSQVGCADGENLTSPPSDWLLVAPDGTLYGTAPSGGKYEANGTLFRLIP